VVVEEPEEAVEVDVHGGGLDHLRVPRLQADAAGGDNFTAVVRAAIEGDGTIEPFRDFIAGGILQPIVTRFCPDRPELRAQLIASQIIGLGMARWVAGLDQVSPLEAESLASLVGPTIQRYLLDELPDTPLDS